jgi:hypothetical protein
VISRICICCGESFRYDASEAGGSQNICAACSQLTEEQEALAVGAFSDELGESDSFDDGIKPQNAS